MLDIFNPVRDITLFSVLLRLVISLICGGLIGIEREYKCRPAGFRTHILICLGACVTVMTSQYLVECMHYYTDMARLGAQVICGIGFIGAGAIVVTRRKGIRGLTTAAGLWVVGIVGLSCGAGYFEASIATTVLVLIAELFFSRLEYRLLSSLRDVNLYIEYSRSIFLSEIIQYLRDNDITIKDLEVSKSVDKGKTSSSVVFGLRLGKSTDYKRLLTDITSMEGIVAVEEL